MMEMAIKESLCVNASANGRAPVGFGFVVDAASPLELRGKPNRWKLCHFSNNLNELSEFGQRL
jgi:hypothetical protein